MAKNIWTGYTTSDNTNWLLFEDNEKTSITGDSNINEVKLKIKPADIGDTGETGSVRFVTANGSKTFTVTRCLPQIKSITYDNLKANISGSLSGNISPCKVSYQQTDSIEISDITANKTTTYVLADGTERTETETISVSLNDVSVYYRIGDGGISSNYLPANNDKDRKVYITLTHKTFKDSNGRLISTSEKEILQYGLKDENGNYKSDMFSASGKSGEDRITIEKAILAPNGEKPTECSGSTEFGISITAFLNYAAKTGATKCGNNVIIESATTVPYGGNLSYKLKVDYIEGNNVTTGISNNDTLIYENKSFDQDAKIYLHAEYEIITADALSASGATNTVVLIVPHGDCHPEINLVINYKNEIDFHGQPVDVIWYFKDSEKKLTAVDGVYVERAALKKPFQYDFCGITAETYNNNTGIATITFDFTQNNKSTERYIEFTVINGYNNSETTYRITQTGLKLKICTNPSEVQIPFSGGNATVYYWLTEDIDSPCEITSPSTVGNIYTGLELSCPREYGACPERSPFNIREGYNSKFSLPERKCSDGDDVKRYTITASCTNVSDDTISIEQEPAPKVYGNISASTTQDIASIGSDVTIYYWISKNETEETPNPLIDEYYVSGIWAANQCKVNDRAFTDSQHLSESGITFNTVINQGGLYAYNFSIGPNVSSKSRQFSFKIGDSKSCNGQKEIQISQGNMLIYVYGTIQPTEISHEGGEVEVRWFVSTKNPLEETPTEEDAIDNEIIKEDFWIDNINQVSASTFNKSYDWDGIPDNVGIKLKGGRGYSNGVCSQKFEILNNTGLTEITYQFRFGHRVRGSSYDVYCTQQLANYKVFIKVSEDFNTELKQSVTLPGDKDSSFVITYWAELNDQIVPCEEMYEEIEVACDDGYDTFSIIRKDTAITTSDCKKQVKYYVQSNNVNKEKKRCYKANYKNAQSQDIISVWQNGKDMTILPDFDYMTFRYNWEGADGKDLDTATIISGITDSDPIYKQLCKNYVGFGGIGPGPGEWQEEKRKPMQNSDTGLKYAEHGGDNTASGLECALIYWKNICDHDYITNGTTMLYCDLWAIWYKSRCNGKCSLTFKMFKKNTEDEIEKEFKKVNINDVVGETDNYGFGPNDERITQVGSTQAISDLLVYAAGSSKGSSIENVTKNYTHIARFSYNILSKTTSFSRVENGEKGFRMEINGTIKIDNIVYALYAHGYTITWINNSETCEKEEAASKSYNYNDAGEHNLIENLKVNSLKEILGDVVTEKEIELRTNINGEVDWLTARLEGDNDNGYSIYINILSINTSDNDREASVYIYVSGNYYIKYTVTQNKSTE